MVSESRLSRAQASRLVSDPRRAQLACRLQVVNDGERAWMLRATHNSDEVHYPSDRRRSTRVSARRLARGPPTVQSSVDFWPGFKARALPPASYPDGEPQAEPPAAQKAAVFLKSSISPHAKSREPSEELRPSPHPASLSV